jgi:hypothetical protein
MHDHICTCTNILIHARILEFVQGLMPQAAPGGGKRKRDGEEGGDSQDKSVTSPRGEKRGDETYEARCVSVCVCVFRSLEFVIFTLTLTVQAHARQRPCKEEGVDKQRERSRERVPEREREEAVTH